jgi:hypothetical protein
MKNFTKAFAFLFLFALAFTSCTKDLLQPQAESNANLNTANLDLKDLTLISKRTDDAKIILSSKELNSGNSKLKTLALPPPLQPEYYLGRSYRADQGVNGDPENVGFKVLDIEDLLRDHPDFYTPLNLDLISAKSASFTSFDRYESKTNSNKTVTAGFSLNLGLFSVGAKNKWTTVYSSSLLSETNRVFGELNVEVKGSSYMLSTTTNARGKMMEGYINPTFIDEIYNSTRKELVDTYGPFVLTNYYTGGKAVALYTGTDTRVTTTESKEKAMDGSINASFGFKVKKDGDGKIGGDFGFANGSGESSNDQHFITQLNIAIRTTGGDKGFGAFTVPKKIEDINIDLGGWIASLNDRSKYNLIGINNGGLNLISDFVLEENFKQSIKIYLTSSSNIIAPTLIKPVIMIRPTHVAGDPNGSTGKALYQFFLVTRFNEFINISPSSLQPVSAFTPALRNQYVAMKKPYFNLDYFAGGDFYQPNNGVNPYVPLVGIEEQTMKKFYYNKTNTTYLLYAGNGKKYALAYHDDFVLDTYGMRTWVNTLPSTTITFSELQTYTVIGL